MSLSKKNKSIPEGDYVTAEEAVMDKESEILTRCETIDEVVKDKVFTLPEALEAYEVNIEQYLAYLMMKGKKVKIIASEKMMIAMINIIFNVMDFSHAKFNTRIQKVVNDMRQLTKVK